MIGVELAVDGAPVVAECLKRRLLINCTHETVLRLLPALTLTDEQLDEGCDDPRRRPAVAEVVTGAVTRIARLSRRTRSADLRLPARRPMRHFLTILDLIADDAAAPARPRRPG